MPKTRLRYAGALIALLAAGATAPCSAQQTKPPQPGQLPDEKGPLALPNTVSAPPLTVAEKFDYRVIQTFGLRGIGGALLSGALGQATGTPYAWGGGMEGFGKRVGSAFAGNVSRQTFAFVIDGALHDDPRYFPADDQPGKARILNAAKQVILTKTDSGHTSFAYARVGSAVAAGQLVNAWQPGSNGSVGDGFERALLSLGGDFAYNLMQEFIPRLRPRSLRNHH